MSQPNSGVQRSHSTARKTVLALCTALLLVGLSGLFVAPPVQAGSTSLSQQLSSLNTQLKDIRANLKKAEAARKAALGDLAALDQSLEYAQAAQAAADAAYQEAARQLAELQGQLEQLTAQLQKNLEVLTKAENDLRERQETLCARVVSMYKSGDNLAYVSALMEDDTLSLTEVAERFDALSAIAEQDVTLIDQIGALKARVEEQRRVLETEQSRVGALEEEQAAVTEGLQEAAAQCQAALDEAAAARAAKQAALAAIERDQATWTRQEDQLLADSDRIAALLKNSSSGTPTKAGSGMLSRPVPGAITSGFGYRVHPIFNVRKLHTGVDFSANAGDPIKAAAFGTVVEAGWRGGYGKCVVIDHGNGLATLYAHQSTILVKVGQTVKRGDVIGKVGSTGYSTGPHLHFEVRVNGSPVDPLGYL